MFVFRLEKALEHRANEEERLKKDFILKKNRLEHEKELLFEKSAEIVNTIQSYADMRKGLLNPMALRNYEIYLKKLKNEKIEQEKVVKIHTKITEEAKNIFVESRKERKVLEKLKEKKFQEYQQEELKKEQKFIDELSNSMFNRRNVNGEREKRS